ncbi:MAG: aminotransferase class I/II-fold pyridoxal phosphate-dependent enzyme, partial [Bacteroidetes bacterium]|nr:aminotransferase class I/II-fold pyridoxal phosphate-dependent enzyme [Bacteroidota bacterium]
MDGDKSDIKAISELALRHDALLMVDEAHATGVFGENGAGLCHGLSVDLVMGTFGKALGSFGAYAACSERMYHYLVNRCGGFIYSTALPPSVIGAVDAALDIVPRMEEERKNLAENARFLRESLSSLGFSTGPSQSQIVPVIIGDEAETLSLSTHLSENGILAVAIRPPTVEKGKSRIRLSLCALHTRQMVENLVSVFASWKRP